MDWRTKVFALICVFFSLAVTYNFNTNCSPEIIQIPAAAVEFDETVLTRNELGLYGWSLLHTMAAYFPAAPTESQLGHAQSFLYYFAELFPCRVCGRHFELTLREMPPKFSSRDEFVVYLCKLHNKVNETLNKTLMECSVEAMNLKWGGGDCGCSA
jgi:FAD-linked sulfhydryl oxidase